MLTSQSCRNSFPSVCIAKEGGKTLIEVHLIASLGHGQADAMVKQAADLQRHHPRFVDALDEPSTCIGELPHSDTDHSSLYTFLVERQGHPFHRHASSRMFTAISGGDGTQLRFSTANLNNEVLNIETFFDNAHCIDLPADCLFTVRFVAGVWHQFVPARANADSPALFAVSCHPDDLSGIDDPSLRADIQEQRASIPMLTEVLPSAMADKLNKYSRDHRFAIHCQSTHQLRFVASKHPMSTAMRAMFASLSRQLKEIAFGVKETGRRLVRALSKPFQDLHRRVEQSLFMRTRQTTAPAHSLVWKQLQEHDSYHLDHFELRIPREQLQTWHGANASKHLSELLEAFIESAPASVGGLMQLRNLIVGPFGLRTSPLACPVSSLLSTQAQDYFQQRFPVWDQDVNAENTIAQVVLGANDKHLQFRSVVMVEIDEEGIVISLSNRVAYRNLFGRFYMSCIQEIHQAYIVPTMLSSAALKLCGQPQTTKEKCCRCWRFTRA